jgi:DNA-binding LytR/AlgR family response regulator
MCKANVLIVEDEFIIAENLSATLAECGYCVVGIADNVDSVLKILSANQIDMILLDINLNQAVDGVEIAHIVNSRFGIPFIFVTAFVDPATIERVKHTYPFGYIVKPYSDIDIRIAIDIALSRAANLSAGKAINAGVKKENTVFIKSDKGLKKFEINDILWMEAYDYYSFIHTRNEKILATITLKEVEQKLNNDIFVRIHRKYTININHIERIVGNQVEIGGNLIPIGRANREEFLMKIKRL